MGRFFGSISAVVVLANGCVAAPVAEPRTMASAPREIEKHAAPTDAPRPLTTTEVERLVDARIARALAVEAERARSRETGAQFPPTIEASRDANSPTTMTLATAWDGPHGKLSIGTTPAAGVFVDGVAWGSTPIVRRIAPGAHKVYLVPLDSRRSAEFVVEVRDQETTIVLRTLGGQDVAVHGKEVVLPARE